MFNIKKIEIADHYSIHDKQSYGIQYNWICSQGNLLQCFRHTRRETETETGTNLFLFLKICALQNFGNNKTFNNYNL